MSRVQHGGRIDEAIAHHGGTRGTWLDLSTGIGPLTYPVPDLPRTIWRDLPDEAAWLATADALRQLVGASEGVGVSLAAGSQQHIQVLPRLFKSQDVAVVGFTYGEHAAQWRAAGHTVLASDGLTSAEATARIIIVVNPNNPDGRIIDRHVLLELARRLAAKGGLLVVDEAFGDVTPNASVAADAGRDGLVVLRSLGKFYGLAGVRLGGALCSPALAERLEASIGPWGVSGPALAIGAAAWSDRTWTTRNRRKLKTMRESLEEMLQRRGLRIAGGTDLFVLAQHSRAMDIARRLAERQILVRAFDGAPQWLRFGLPAGKVASRRLDSALAKAIA